MKTSINNNPLTDQPVELTDRKYMSRCLQLAQYGAGYVAPNPMVGAVLVCDGKIIGEGYHKHFGEAHAEPNAINSVHDKELLKCATLYVSLEPCSHYGKTPPCADLIVSCAIPRVVIGTLDPNPNVAGRGVEILRNAGIDVTVGVLENECCYLNKRFFAFFEKRRPYVTLKWAQSHDGFIDLYRTEPQQKPVTISNSVTQQLTHKMRSENQAILVSTNTVLLDNPSLTVRNWSGKNPVRIAIDRQGRIPQDFHLLDGSVPTIIFTEMNGADARHLKFEKISFDNKVLQTILHRIYELNIHSVLVEGGAQLLNSFIQSGLWDEANVEVAPLKLVDGVKAPVLPLQPVSHKNFDGHAWLSYKNNNDFVID